MHRERNYSAHIQKKNVSVHRQTVTLRHTERKKLIVHTDGQNLQCTQTDRNVNAHIQIETIEYTDINYRQKL